MRAAIIGSNIRIGGILNFDALIWILRQKNCLLGIS
jgi:hypothetical protein